MKKVETIDDYIASFDGAPARLLQQMRRTIQKAAPQAAEKISYGIPTFYLKENLVHFAAYKNHMGFYPGGAVLDSFKSQLSGFKASKGTVQFPIDEPIPWGLVTKIVRARVASIAGKSAGEKRPSMPTSELKEFLLFSVGGRMR
jgi:uncharacterized protein YdhG (YjbR/CyaY superfamily)